MNRIEDVERQILLLWEDMAEARGFDRILGRIICILLIEGRPLSQQEIAEKAEYSVPSISKALKTLVSLGSVRKAKKTGKRITLYYVEMHPSDMLSGALMKWVLTAKAMKRRTITILKELEEAKDEDPERAEKLTMILRDFAVLIPKITGVIENAIRNMEKKGL